MLSCDCNNTLSVITLNSLQVLSIAVLAAASVSIADVSIDTAGVSSDVEEMVDDSRSAAGFMIFVSVLVILIEMALITVRFLNFGAVNRFFLVFVILVCKNDHKHPQKGSLEDQIFFGSHISNYFANVMLFFFQWQTLKY